MKNDVVRYGNDVYYISADHTSGAEFLLTQTIGGIVVYQLMFDGDAAARSSVGQVFDNATHTGIGYSFDPLTGDVTSTVDFAVGRRPTLRRSGSSCWQEAIPEFPSCTILTPRRSARLLRSHNILTSWPRMLSPQRFLPEPTPASPSPIMASPNPCRQTSHRSPSRGSRTRR